MRIENCTNANETHKAYYRTAAVSDELVGDNVNDDDDDDNDDDDDDDDTAQPPLILTAFDQ